MQAWDEFLRTLDQELGADTVNKWLRTLKVARFDACNLYLHAKDSFQALWFEEHIRKRADENLVNNNQKKIRVHLTTATDAPKGRRTRQRTEKPSTPKPTLPANTPPPPFKLHFDDLDPHCSFQHLVLCKGNLLAYKLLGELTGYDPESNMQEQPDQELASFNPIYLYGPNGVGKTHMLMATARALTEMGLRVLYSRSETFTEHVISAMRSGEMRTFRQAYRNIDVLVVDDVHVFSRKGATQEEFFHTFNTLHVENKQIILSANCPPQELELIEPRLVSRFEWGIVLPLETLQKEELRRVLKEKARALQFQLEDKVADYLLETFTSNPKALCRALEALILRTHINQQTGKGSSQAHSVGGTSRLLNDLVQEEKKTIVTPEQIVQAVAEHYGIRVEDILSKAQSRDCVTPRQVAMHLCRQQLNLPYTKIGSIFSRDHSTVMSSVRQIKKKMDANNADLTSSVKSILKVIAPNKT